jgi:ribosomal protein S1
MNNLVHEAFSIKSKIESIENRKSRIGYPTKSKIKSIEKIKNRPILSYSTILSPANL